MRDRAGPPAPASATDTHTDPCPARTATAPSGAGNVRATAFVLGSTATSCRWLPDVSTHTAPSPAPIEDSAGSRAGTGISAMEAPLLASIRTSLGELKSQDIAHTDSNP